MTPSVREFNNLTSPVDSARMTSNHSPWMLSPPVGELRSDGLSARVDIARPDLGLHQLEWDGRQLAGQLFGLRRDAQQASLPAGNPRAIYWPLAVGDAYVRGDDLVASYRPQDDWPYSPQIYWCVDRLPIPGLICSLSLLVSLQTHLLNTWPRISIGSQLHCTELLQLSYFASGNHRSTTLPGDHTIEPSGTACCLLWRLSGIPLSYAEMAPTSDVRELKVSHEGGSRRTVWRLSDDFLEKGVIRRARLHGVFVLREHDLQKALACCEAIERRPLPLTT